MISKGGWIAQQDSTRKGSNQQICAISLSQDCYVYAKGERGIRGWDFRKRKQAVNRARRKKEI
jgi:hypothetical protein